MMRDSFSGFHPVINFTYFTVVILFSMFFMHPIFQGISLISALSYSISLKGKAGIKTNMALILPIFIFMTFFNTVFNHEGATILFYLKSGNPVTLESTAYGIASAAMLTTVILWFSCYNTVMTSDKFIYLFGRIIPSISLILSMVLRFVPMYKEQIIRISNAQKCIGKDVSQGNLMQRAKNGIKIISIMTTWSLENAIITADSMCARGYGLPGRSSFSLYKFDKRNKIIFYIMLILIIIVLSGSFTGHNKMRFFPTIKLPDKNFYTVLVYSTYVLLNQIPTIVNITEGVKWKHIESKI